MDSELKGVLPELFQTIAENSLDGILVVDQDDIIRFWSGAARRLLGFEPEDAVGEKLHKLLATQTMTSTYTAGKNQVIEAKIKNSRGRQLWVDLNFSSFQVQDQTWKLILVRDVQPRHKTIELEKAATTDPLSGLANRRQFQKSLEANIGKSVTLAIIDIDHFKRINDTLGHPVGDDAIVETARVIAEQFPNAETVARLGGDEFGILLVGDDFDSSVDRLSNLCKEVASSHYQPQNQLSLTVSIGVGLCPELMETRQLLAVSDAALYEAKNAGRNCVRVQRVNATNHAT